MDRRAFLSGLFGVAGVAALGGLTMRQAEAAPIARALDQTGITPDAVELPAFTNLYCETRVQDLVALICAEPESVALNTEPQALA